MDRHTADDGRDRATANFFSSINFEADLERQVEEKFDGGRSRYDEAYIETWKVTIGLTALLDELRERVQDPSARDLIDNFPNVESHLDTLDRAANSGLEVLKSCERSPRAKRDLSELQPAVLREARGEMVYVAHHLGIEISLPDPKR